MSPRCHIPSCLGHADERTAEVACARCACQRWILVRPATAPDPTDYICIRCKAVLAGKNASDSLVTPERRARLVEGIAKRRSGGTTNDSCGHSSHAGDQVKGKTRGMAS